jgi:lysophospholipase L1-like esterase
MVPVLRSIAQENATAYWDFFAAMGGKKSIKTFVKKRMAWDDFIHLTKPGHEAMADRLMCALHDAMTAWLAKNPRAGCEE